MTPRERRTCQQYSLSPPQSEPSPPSPSTQSEPSPPSPSTQSCPGCVADAPSHSAFVADDRAVSSVVGKTLELGLLALFVGLLVSTFYGGVIPEYRSATGASIADRTVAGVGTDVESAVPATDKSVVDVDVERTVDVPHTIRGDRYRIGLDGNGDLVLDHPRPDLSRTVPLSLPPDVTTVEGTVRSGETLVVIVESTSSGFVVRLEGR